MALACRGATRSPTPWLVWPQLLCNTGLGLGTLSSWITWKILCGFQVCQELWTEGDCDTRQKSLERGHLEVLGDTGFRRKVP